MARPAFRAGAVHVRVPATSANLGPGFDALGLALALYDDVVARVVDEGLAVDVAGEGADQCSGDETHLVVRSMRAAFTRLGGQPPGLELSCANRIPHGRGLGSSAAAIVAGVLLARSLVVGGAERLPGPALLRLAAEIEGHPDNVAPAVLGGLTVAWSSERGDPADPAGPGVAALRLEPVPSVQPVALIPPFGASTAAARTLLPATVSHADAAFTAGRAALLVAALTTAPALLLAATEDRLHQEYRRPVLSASLELVTALRADGLAALVSGAGPTVLVLARDDTEASEAAAAAPAGWRALPIAIDRAGARVLT